MIEKWKSERGKIGNFVMSWPGSQTVDLSQVRGKMSKGYGKFSSALLAILFHNLRRPLSEIVGLCRILVKFDLGWPLVSSVLSWKKLCWPLFQAIARWFVWWERRVNGGCRRSARAAWSRARFGGTCSRARFGGISAPVDFARINSSGGRNRQRWWTGSRGTLLIIGCVKYWGVWASRSFCNWKSREAAPRSDIIQNNQISFFLSDRNSAY